VQLLGLVHKIAMFPHLFDGFENILETNEQTKFLRRLKGGHLQFLELKKKFKIVACNCKCQIDY